MENGVIRRKAAAIREREQKSLLFCISRLIRGAGTALLPLNELQILK